MSFVITGLDPAEFDSLVGLPDEALAVRGVIRRVVDKTPGYPCRVTLEDAEPGERVLLLNYESHSAPTPYRSTYAIYVREDAKEAPTYEDEIPPVFRGRPLSFRHFDEAGMLIGASLVTDAHVKEAISRAFGDPNTAYIDAHNAAHGCFAARINRA
ncbi:MAG: DUF1203 domain-containing protein [Amphiplicatus sp.]